MSEQLVSQVTREFKELGEAAAGDSDSERQEEKEEHIFFLKYYGFRATDWSHVTELEAAKLPQNIDMQCMLQLVSLMSGVERLLITNYGTRIRFIPSTFSRLTRLKHLDMSWNAIGSNQYVNGIPSTLQECSQLEHLDLSDNNMSYLPAFLQKMQSLKTVYRNGNRLDLIHYSMRTNLQQRINVARSLEPIKMQKLWQLAGEALLKNGDNRLPDLPKHLEEDVMRFSLDSGRLITCTACGKRQGNNHIYYLFDTYRHEYLGNSCIPFRGFGCSESCAQNFATETDCDFEEFERATVKLVPYRANVTNRRRKKCNVM